MIYYIPDGWVTDSRAPAELAKIVATFIAELDKAFPVEDDDEDGLALCESEDGGTSGQRS